MLSLLCSIALAQSVRIEATRLDPSRPPPSVTVVEVREREPVLDVLARVPGLRIVANGGAGQPASVFVRGGPPEQTLVLLDGVEMNDPSGVSRGFDLSRLTTEGIERIEVYRGPETLRYGTSAAGGVVNLVSRPGGARAFSIAGEAGSYSTTSVYTGSRGTIHALKYALGVSRFETQGFSAVRDGAEADGTRQLGFHSRLDYDVSATARATLTTRLTSAATDLDGAGADDTTLDSRVRERALGASYRGRAFEGRLLSSVELALHDMDRGFAEGRFRGANQSLTTRHVYTLEDVELEGVAQYRAETSTGARQDALGAAAIARWGESAFGLRFDHLAGAGDPVTANFQPVRTWGQLRVAGRLATGFRQPSLYQRFSPFGYVSLRAERTVAYEISGAWRPGAWSFSVTPFEQSYRDLIDFDLASSRFANVARARIRGVESEVGWSNPRWSWRASHTYLDAGALTRRPAHAFSSEGSWTNGVWRTEVYVRGVGARADVDPVSFTTVRDPYYDVAGARATWTFERGWRANVRIENLFDRDYQDVRGYGTSRRAFYIGFDGEI